MSITTSPRRASFDWPRGEPYEDVQRGTLKSGKEAEIFLVERRYATSGPRLIAHKRYRPRYPHKDQLRDEGFSNSTSYRGDAVYKAGWFLPKRDKRAVMTGSRYGHELAARLWPMQEWSMLRSAWEAGVSVPYPVEQTDLGLMMEFIGDEDGAAPKLAQARLSADDLASAWRQLTANLVALTMAGLRPRRPVDLQPVVVAGPAGCDRPSAGRGVHDRTPMRSTCCTATSRMSATGSSGEGS